MHSPDIVRKNIRTIIDTLGKERELTRKEFAEKYLHISDTHFSNMLAGRKEIPEEIIIYISHFFFVPLPLLCSIEIDHEVMARLHEFIDLDKYQALSDKVLNLFESNYALEDPLFTKALQFYDQLINESERQTKENWNLCKKLFYMLFKSKDYLCCAANTAIVIIMEYCDLGVTEFIKRQSGSTTLMDIMEMQEMIAEERKLLKKAFLEENETIYEECIQALAQNEDTKDFAMFLVILRYILAMTDNGVSDYTNSNIIGITMLDELHKIGNKYAVAFFEMFQTE